MLSQFIEMPWVGQERPKIENMLEQEAADSVRLNVITRIDQANNGLASSSDMCGEFECQSLRFSELYKAGFLHSQRKIINLLSNLMYSFI